MPVLPLIRVFPDNDSAEQHAAELLEESGERVHDGRRVTTLRTLLDDLRHAARPELRVVDPLTQRLLVRQILSDLSDGSVPRGLVDAVRRSLDDCHAAEVDAALLGEAVDPARPESRLLLRVLEAYDGKLVELGLTDPAAVDARLADALAGGAPLPPADRLPPGARLVLEGGHRWTGARVRLLQALSERLASAGGGVTVRLPEAPGHPGFASMVAVRRLFESLGGEGLVDLEAALPRSEPRAPALETLARGVFDHQSPGAPVPDGGEVVELLSAADARAEARAVAGRVRDLVRAGTAPDDIVVSARQLSGAAAAALTEAFFDVGMPLRDRRGRPVPTVGPVRVLLELVRVAREGFTRDALLPLVYSRYLDFSPAAGSSVSVAPWQVARWLRRCGAVDTANETYSEAIRRAAKGERDERARAAAEAVAAHLARLLPRLAELGRPGTVTEHAERLRGALTSLRVRERVQAQGAHLLTTEPGGLEERLGAVEALARDQAALRALDEALEEAVAAAAVLGQGDRVFSGAELGSLLSDALELRVLPAPALRGGAVRLLAVDDLGAVRAKVLVLTGLTDGDFPSPGDEDPLLGDAERLALNRRLARPAFAVLANLDRQLERAPDRRVEETWRFAMALHLPSERLLLTWPRTDDRGRPAVPSPYVSEVLRVLTGGPPDFGRVQVLPLAPIPSTGRALTRADLEVALAADLYGPPEGRSGSFPQPLPLPDAVAGSLGSSVLATLSPRVAVERERHHFFADPEASPRAFTGRLEKSRAQVAARFEATEDQPLSVSGLEQLARCPFAAMAGRALRLEPVEERDETLDARGRGSLIHACLQRAWEALATGGMLPLTEARAAEASARAREAALEEAEQWRSRSEPGDPHLFELDVEDVVTRVAALVESESREGGGWYLEGAEVAFGGGDSAWPPLKLEPEAGPAIHMRGRIDRVDRRETEAGIELRVLDYKHGDHGRQLFPARLGITALQIPAYLEAARRQAPDAHVDGGYVRLKAPPARLKTLGERLAARGNNAWKEYDLSVDEVLDGDGPAPPLAERAAELLETVRSGELPPRPTEDACDFCELADVCRIVEPPAADGEPE